MQRLGNSGAAAGRELAPEHHLLPHERWFASLILERQRTHRTPAILRMEQNYGPEGITLMSAAIISGLIGVIVGFIGLALLFSSGDRGPLLHPGYYLTLAAVLLELPSIYRSIQATYAGRRFRGDRPFIKRP